MVKPAAAPRRAPKRPIWTPPERALFATDPANARGRLYSEPESATRTPFQRDRDRIIHATAFRRLKQKTQVFIAHEGDHYRTRLTHSLEVAQIARSCARTLGLDEDLAEAIALAHDLGHPPFGHAGEDELAECMAPYGGFDHNAQTLKVLTKLERRYPEFDGLNLTWETLEGVVKHNGPLINPQRPMAALPTAFRDFAQVWDLDYQSFAGPEAQVAALADDIAYNNHDIDDGLRAKLFTIEELSHLPLVGEIFAKVRQEYPKIETERWIAESVRRLIGVRIDDLVNETKKRVEKFRPQSVEDVRGLGEALVAFSAEMYGQEQALRKFLRERMYRHYRVSRMRSRARRILRELFHYFMEEPDLLPDRWREHAKDCQGAPRAALVCDYIAGMTDSFAIEEHRKLHDLTDLI